MSIIAQYGSTIISLCVYTFELAPLFLVYMILISSLKMLGQCLLTKYKTQKYFEIKFVLGTSSDFSHLLFSALLM